MKTCLKRYWLMVLLLCLIPGYGFGETVPFEEDRWTFIPEASDGEGFTAEMGEHLGQPALLLDRGFALVKDMDVKNGIIEYDVAASGETGTGGALWRKTGDMDYETFVIRAHQSGNPDAAQYGVVFNNVASWQLYHAGYMAAVDIPTDEWMHVKIVLWETYAEIYVNNASVPLLTINGLKKDAASGLIGLQAGLGLSTGPLYFANFSYTDIPTLEIAIEPEATPEGTVSAWLVSDLFSESMLENRMYLTESDRYYVDWTMLEGDSQGMTNLARLQRPAMADGGAETASVNNTVFARTTILSTKAGIKQMRIGFSDKIKLFLNGQAVFSADDTSLSRDYRFAGSAGLFDSVYLPLKEGVNELWAAVSETDMMGWGIQAQFIDPDGITITLETEPEQFRSNDLSDNECMAVYYSSGRLVIPCISIDPNFGVNDIIWELDMKQKLPTTAFQIDRIGVHSP